MTAPLVSTLRESVSIGFPLKSRLASNFVSNPGRSERLRKMTDVLEVAERAKACQDNELDILKIGLLESLPQGVIVVWRNLQPFYQNLKAQELCQQLSTTNLSTTNSVGQGLPVEVADVCCRLTKANLSPECSIVLECFSTEGQVIRITARWLNSNAGSQNSLISGTALPISNQALILVSLENRHETLQKELRIDQRKYDLTEREAEIWMLLRQEYSYQEIAKMLQISLNTVKTHVKNVYAKKRSCQDQDRFWCLE